MNTSNVTVGKPKTSGALFHAPVGTTLPVNATADLASEYKELGYASSDGITEAQEITVNNIVAWGGDVVDSSEASKKKTFKIKLIEAVNKEVLSVVYNADNVTGTLETGIEIHENGDPHEREIFVFDELCNECTDGFLIANIDVAFDDEIGDGRLFFGGEICGDNVQRL